MCWLEILKNHVLTCHLSLILYSNSESLLRLWHVMKSGFYATASSVVGPRNSKALPKAKLAPKKRSWSLFGGLLSVWSTTAFWLLVKPLQLCSANRWDALKLHGLQLALVNRKGRYSPCQRPNAYRTTSASEVEWIGLRSFASSATFTWPLTKRLPLLQASWQLFAGKILP